MKHWVHSLRFQVLYPVFAIVICVALMLTFFTTRIFTNAMLHSEQQKTESDFAIIGEEIDSTISIAAMGALVSSQTDEVALYVENAFETSKERVLARMNFVSSIEEIMRHYSNLYGVMFIRNDGSLFGALPIANLFFDDISSCPFPSELLTEIRSAKGEKTTWIGPISGLDIGSTIYKKEKLPQNVMLGVRDVLIAHNGSIRLVCIIDETACQQHLELIAGDSSNVFLALPEGDIFAAAGKDFSLSSETIAQVLSAGEKGSIVVNDEDEPFYISFSKLPSEDWFLVKATPMEQFQGPITVLRRTVWVVAASIMLLALLFYHMWLKKFINTFNALREGIDRIKNGDLRQAIRTTSSITEFEDIRKDFDEMEIALQQQIQTTKEMERSQLELEIKALQTQLSPHMIFNSLTAIRWMSVMMGADCISDMLTELGEMLRPVFYEWRNLWTIREELGHLQHYARLLDLRYRNHFTLECAIGEEMNEVMIPRFTLQPLVENACEHGTVPNRALEVKIDASIVDDWVTIVVENNGESIENSKIDEINDMLRNGHQSHHVGLANVYKRLQICLGEDSKLTVERVETGGTRIIISWKKQ